MLSAYQGVIYMGAEWLYLRSSGAEHWIPYMQLIRGPLL